MKDILRNTLADTAPVARAAFSMIEDLPHPAAFPLAFATAAAISTAALGTFLVTETGSAILSALRRRARPPETRPASASLRGTPTPAEIAADGAIAPRTLAIRLRLGSRLADLEPTLDSTTHYDTSPTGARRIAYRGRGVKGWLEDNRIAIAYGTLMKYKKLANRLRRLLSLDARLPLEWLIPGSSPDHEIPPALRAQYHTARRHLSRLIREHRNFHRLSKHVESALGIPKLLAIRRTAKRPPTRRRRTVHPPSAAHPPAITHGSRSILLEETRAAATKRELLLFLKAPDLPPKLDKLRQQALAWLAHSSP
ncbi:MAG: hypothetical protein IKQ55_03375 [Kiritimatiellae bacterium]|nr:hypothetical protein [Kiritimatiellia bacterium]